MPNKSGVAEQILSLPKGGGAIKGIGEKFQPDLHTGTGNFSIPMAVPPGRNGFQPQLTLTYSTGNGNGPFGLGWSLGIPGVTLKTSKGIPSYHGKDIYILSGAEDLILVKDETVGQEKRRYYRPRTEGLFARIIYVTGDGKNHWEVTSKSGTKSIYGKDSNSRIYDENQSDHIFEWLLSETEDTNGNRIVYTYKREDKSGLQNEWYEVNHEYNQLFLSKIQYVNYQSGMSEEFLFSVEFDYGEYDDAGNATGVWAYRPDPFSAYRAGFEIRTVRLCRRILIKVHEEEVPEGKVIKAYKLRYLDELSEQERKDEPIPFNRVSLLAEVTLTGCREDQGHVSEKSFPPLAFQYTRFDPDKRRYETFTAQGGYLPERALTNSEYEIIDLHGYGLPDVIHTSNAGFRYWRNLGNCHFDFPHPMHQAPAGVTLADAGVRFAGMEGTGSADLLVTNSPLTGYYPTTFNARWDNHSFVKYNQAPSFNLKDPDVKLVDMDGDGIIDVLRTGNPHFAIFYNHGKKGWDSEVRHIPRGQLEDFPDVYFSAPDQRVRLAAMGGDGMQDIVLIHDRLIQYWPNMGYGEWGKRITMRNAPELPRNYDPRRLFLVDIDGDGYADLIYVDFGKVHYWINQGGNAWSEEHVIQGTPTVSDVDSVRVADMKGTGTAGILWTYDYSLQNRTNYKYLDLTGGIKPYILNKMNNNIGATTMVAYAPSTKFYLEDLSKNQPWLTHLPFPVQVVEKVEVIDNVSKGKLVTRYAYHHGCWDGDEKEFRGFGYVEQYDTETFEDYKDPGLHGIAENFLSSSDKKHFSPPTLTKTWFHVGKDIDYWNGSVDIEKLRILPDNLDIKAKHEALRTLRGSILRTELYALDGSPLETKPYTVTGNRYRIEDIARNPAHDGDPDAPICVFFPHLHETITSQFERGDEPRKNHVINLYDAFGNIIKEIKIGEPRKPELANPSDYLVLVTDTSYALNHSNPDIYIKDRISETLILDPSPADHSLIQTYIIEGTEPNWKEIRRAGSKIFGHTQNYYDGEAYKGLELGYVDKGNLVRTKSLVLTQEILDTAYPAPPSGTYPESPDALRNLQALHYEHDIEGYWVETTKKKYDWQDPASGSSFGLVVILKDSNDKETKVEFVSPDSPYRLFPVKVTDAVGLSTGVKYDYQALAPWHQEDPNGNETEYAFDALGMLTAIAVKGKGEGDRLDKPTAEYRYDLLSFNNQGKPIHFHSLQREKHKGSTFFESWEYFDGFGRSIQKKVEAEPATPGGQPRYVGSGWQIYNNKGWVVEKYEPFFTDKSEYEDGIKQGVHITMHYDPLGRAIRTINPDGSFQQVVYGSLANVTVPEAVQPNPWEAYFYDENDNGGFKYDPNGNKVERQSAEINDLKIQTHLNTPKKEIYDAWGRLVEVQEDNGVVNGISQIYVTKYAYDLLGRLTKVTDAQKRKAFKHIYDLLGNKLRIENIDAGVRVFVSDAAGNLVEKGDSKGAKVTTTYDDIHRPLEVKGCDDSTQDITLREKYTYDGLAGATPSQTRQKNWLGKVTQIYDGAGKLTFDLYDFKGNILKKTRRVLKDTEPQAIWPETDDAARDQLLETSTGFVIETEYDALNRVTSITYPDLTKVKHEYNNGNLLEKVIVGSDEYVKNIDYNEKGQRMKIECGNGVVTEYTYDTDTFRLKTLKTQNGNRALLQDFDYVYDLVGNIITLKDRTPGSGILNTAMGKDALDRAFTYDPLYRLFSATGRECDTPLPTFPWVGVPGCTDPTRTRAYKDLYKYDSVGNMEKLQHLANGGMFTRVFTIALNTNRLLTVTVGSRVYGYTYDDNSNLTQENTTRRFEWDYADRMKGAEKHAGTEPASMEAKYFYDSRGIRAKKVVRNGRNLTKTTIYIDGLFEEYIKKLGNNVKEHKQFKHITDGTNRIAIVKELLVTTNTDDEPPVLYQHSDHLGSSNVVTKDDGSFFNREEYYPYGETSFGSYAKKRYRFTGKERDEETSLIYYESRYYYSHLGRFISCDIISIIDTQRLIREPQRLHGISYALNSPIVYVDRTGTEATLPPPSLPPKPRPMGPIIIIPEGGKMPEIGQAQPPKAPPKPIPLPTIRSERGTGIYIAPFPVSIPSGGKTPRTTLPPGVQPGGTFPLGATRAGQGAGGAIGLINQLNAWEDRRQWHAANSRYLQLAALVEWENNTIRLVSGPREGAIGEWETAESYKTGMNVGGYFGGGGPTELPRFHGGLQYARAYERRVFYIEEALRRASSIEKLLDIVDYLGSNMRYLLGPTGEQLPSEVLKTYIEEIGFRIEVLKSGPAIAPTQPGDYPVLRQRGAIS